MGDNPDLATQIEIIEETYAEPENEVTLKIAGLQNQLSLTNNKRNDIIRINRLAKTVIDVFDDILGKEKLDKADLRLIVNRIDDAEDRIDVKLNPDVDALLRSDRATIMDNASNFKTGNEVILNHEGRRTVLNIEESLSNTTKVRLKTRNQPERLFTVNVISSGDFFDI